MPAQPLATPAMREVGTTWTRTGTQGKGTGLTMLSSCEPLLYTMGLFLEYVMR
jgi:hypothetical protein